MLVTTVILALGPTALHWNGPANYTLRGHSHGHTYAVTLKQANFAPRGRTIYWHYVEGSYEGSNPSMRAYYPAWKAHGKSHNFKGYDSISKEDIHGVAAATFLAKRNTELIAIKVLVDGRAWKVPSRLYAGCLDPDFGQANASAKLSRDGKTVTVSMDGSDGGGGYHMTWTLRKNGKDSVREEGEA